MFVDVGRSNRGTRSEKTPLADAEGGVRWWSWLQGTAFTASSIQVNEGLVG